MPGEGLSETDIYLAVATIVVFGIGGQWIGRRFGFPSLLLLLPLGLLAGDVLGLVQPEALLGDLLFPTVELLVALLLFQSGLQLRFACHGEPARRPPHQDHGPAQGAAAARRATNGRTGWTRPR